jgi:hypothetical protein
MATHHSKTGRAKGTDDKIVVPSWDSIWQSFKATNEKTTVEAMRSDGWRLVADVAQELGLSKQGVFDQINSNKLDSIKKKVYLEGKTREMRFVRPKVTTSQ